MNAYECSIFHDLSRSVEYHIIVAVKGTICLTGAVRVMQQWQKYVGSLVECAIRGVAFLVHDNTKILFRFYYALNIIIAAIFGFLYLSELIRLRFECFLFDFRYILLTRCVAIATVFAAHQLIIVISFERLYSTIFPGHFEKHSSKPLSVALGLAAIVSAYLFALMKMSDNFRLFYERKVALLNESVPENREGFQSSLHFTHSLTGQMESMGNEELITRIAHSTQLQILIATMTLCNCLSLLMLALDLYLNLLRKPKIAASLGVSYQITENRRILLTLLPIELTQSFLSIFTTIALLIHGKYIPIPTPLGAQLFLELVTFPMYFPLILTFFIKYSVEKSINRSPPADPQLDHIETLRLSWLI